MPPEIAFDESFAGGILSLPYEIRPGRTIAAGSFLLQFASSAAALGAGGSFYFRVCLF